MSEGSTNSGSNTAVIIVVVVLGVVLLIAAVCGGLVYFMVRTTQQMAERMVDVMEEALEEQQRSAAESERAARAFLDDLRGNRLEAAYRATTPDFQKGMTQDELAKVVAQHAFLKETKRGERIELDLITPESAEHEYQAWIDVAPGKQASVSIVVRKIGEGWQVDRLVITEGPAVPKKP
jgi:uncharacterized membrane protein